MGSYLLLNRINSWKTITYMKKPSEIIKEKANDIANQYNDDWIIPSSENKYEALLSYLDEEKERVNGILHEIVDKLQRHGELTDFSPLHAMIDAPLSDKEGGE